MLRFSTAGESHGEALVATVSGMPAGVPVDQEFVDRELWRRQQGYGRGGRMKIERDRAELLSGVRFGKSLGGPIALLVPNLDWENWTVEDIVEPGPGHEMTGDDRWVQLRRCQAGVPPFGHVRTLRPRALISPR